MKKPLNISAKRLLPFKVSSEAPTGREKTFEIS